MIAFSFMLAGAAEQAGMKVPADTDNFDAAEYPHFRVYLSYQLGRRVSPGQHWENAKRIAAIPDDRIKLVTFNELFDVYGCV